MSYFEITDLSKAYGQKKALQGVSLQVNRGEIVALIGKNGAGKTTMLHCIAGNIAPDGGGITFEGDSLLKSGSKLDEFGILIEACFFDYLNAGDNLSLLMRASGFANKHQIQEKVDEVLNLVGLSDKKSAYVKSFSFGMKQRLGLAQALLHEPRFLILDEPFVGLDPIGKRILKDVILQKAHVEQAGILFSSHDLFDVGEICDRIIMFESGKKLFDGVFEYGRTYRIITAHPIPERILPRLQAYKVTTGADYVELLDPHLLNPILEHLISSGNQVKDIIIRENSLYDYFEQEVTYENTAENHVSN